MATTNAATISPDVKKKIIDRMLPPNNESVVAISKETGIISKTLYNWRSKALHKLNLGEAAQIRDDKWSSHDKFLFVVESFAMNEFELGEYCRTKGIYLAELLDWRKMCAQANSANQKQTVADAIFKKEAQDRLQSEQLKVCELEKEIRRKDKALAETAALLVLRKKASAIWGENADE